MSDSERMKGDAELEWL